LDAEVKALLAREDEMATKRKTAKSKSAKKSSAKAAKSKGAASKRSVSKRAKTKIAKRKTTKRTIRADQCRQEREARDQVRDEIRDIHHQLDDFDIPDDTRKRLEELRSQKQERLVFLQQQLDECEAKHGPA
jgi:hypothetical protein